MPAIGMVGDLLRGATPINLPQAIEFGEKAIGAAMVENPDHSKFIIYVNPFKRFITKRIADRFNGGDRYEFKVHTDETYAKDSWRIEPVE